MPSSAEMCYAVRTVLPQQQRMKYLQDLEDEIRHVVSLYPAGIHQVHLFTLSIELVMINEFTCCDSFSGNREDLWTSSTV
jgi:hypothetical protein